MQVSSFLFFTVAWFFIAVSQIPRRLHKVFVSSIRFFKRLLLVVVAWRHKFLKSKFTGPAKFLWSPRGRNAKNISFRKFKAKLYPFRLRYGMLIFFFEISALRDTAMAPEQSCCPWKKGLLLRFLQLKQFKYWEICLCVCVLACKERAIAFIAEGECQRFSSISGRYVGAHANRALAWRLYTELYKYAWNVLANNSTRYVVQTWDLEILFI